ncbi:MAG: SLBB domain-containing protein [bacterium]
MRKPGIGFAAGTSRRPRPARLFRVVLLLVGVFVLAARAQTTWPSQGSQQAQVLTFKYYVWGHVRSPGAYNLGANPDVIELLSAAGGPNNEANLKRVMLVRSMSSERVRLDVSRLLEKGDVVPLSPGDVVIVPRSAWYTIRNELWAVTALGVLINLGLTIYVLTGGTR